MYMATHSDINITKDELDLACAGVVQLSIDLYLSLLYSNMLVLPENRNTYIYPLSFLLWLHENHLMRQILAVGVTQPLGYSASIASCMISLYYLV